MSIPFHQCNIPTLCGRPVVSTMEDGRRRRWPSFFFLLLPSLSPAFAALHTLNPLPGVNPGPPHPLQAIRSSTISPGSPLFANQTLLSSGVGAFALGFFSPDSAASAAGLYVGVRFNTIPVQNSSYYSYFWVANRHHAVSANAALTIAANGTLALVDGATVVWSASPPAPLRAAVAELLSTGNLVIREEASTAAAWQSFWHPTDTIVADMSFGVNRTAGLNTTLTPWKSEADPSPGPYAAYMDLTGDPQIVIVSVSDQHRVWRLGQSYAGVYYDSVLADADVDKISWDFDADAAVFSYHVVNTDGRVLMMLRLNSSGVLQRWMFTDRWVRFDYEPKDVCDRTSACGRNSVCNLTAGVKYSCSCLPGFIPEKRSGEGCVPAAPPDCWTDGTAVTVGNMKLPDMAGTATNTGMGLEECRSACLGNCSCTAYAATKDAESGCVMWFGDLVDLRVYSDAGAGQELYVKVPHAAVQSQEPKGNLNDGTRTALIASISAVGVFCIFAFAGCFLWRSTRRTSGVPMAKNVLILTLGPDDSADNDGEEDFPLLDLEIIAIATDNFSTTNKLGQGGFGPVYKGKLPDGQEIAVKRNAKTSSQGINEFKNEVRLIAKLQHRNLVRLIGCSIFGEERFLVYEYMPNKSLDLHIFDQARSIVLNWPMRYRIIEGIVRGMLYLHEDSRMKIIHRDLKASNILLDRDMNPKISDFGIARAFNDEDEINTRRVVGTYGYMSPEYALEGAFSVKSDVFSFGILMLEIVSGRRNRGGYFSNNLSLVDYAWKLWKQGKILKLVDESMDCSYPTEEVVKCIKVGLLCIQEMPQDRPLMSDVMLMLRQDVSSLPEPKHIGYTAMRGYNNQESSTSKSIESDSTVPITILDAR